MDDQNYLNKITEYDVENIASPLCDDALEEHLLEQFKANEQAATLKGKLRSDCKDFKRLSLPYEHLMLQVINLVEDVISKNISFEIGQRLSKDIQITFSKFKSKDDSYENCKTRGMTLKSRCTLCINKYNTYIENVNLLGIRSTIEDMILCHYLCISVIPVLDLYRDIVISFEKIIERYTTSVEFFKSDAESESDLLKSPRSPSSNVKLQTENVTNVTRNNKSKNLFASLAPVIIGIGSFLIAAFLMKKILQ